MDADGDDSTDDSRRVNGEFSDDGWGDDEDYVPVEGDYGQDRMDEYDVI